MYKRQPDNTLDILRRSTAQRLKKKFTFQADPFLLEKEDKLYIFYEAFNFRNSKGILRCRILDKNLKELDDVKLEGFDNLKCHLSFPFLFTTNAVSYTHLDVYKRQVPHRMTRYLNNF